MFRKLRNHLILINTVITTVVLVIAFTTIYIVAQNSTMKRPFPRGGGEFSQRDNQIIEERVRDERKAALGSLLVSLIVVGVIVEVAVIIVSYYLAEIAIRPIRETYEMQKIFIANASHEIKTPLAAISANLEAADIQDNRWIDNVDKEVKALTALNQELLELARADSAKENLSDASTIEVKKLLDEVVSGFEPRVQKMKIEVSVRPKNAKIEAVAKDLRQILVILLDNAVKYGERKVTLEYRDQEICVANDGAKISDEDLVHVFERFYQADKNAEGAGLGLAIARALAERNGWSLSISSDTETQVRLRMR